MEKFVECQRLAEEKHPKTGDKIFQYGTAGFRARGDELGYVLFRMGILASLRSRVMKAAIGVMITASHNPAEDNGVKLIDPHGEMLSMDWEGIATSLANVSDRDLSDETEKIITGYSIDLTEPATIIIGRDTRESSRSLRDAAVDGARSLNSTIIDKDLLTTPQLHYIVNNYNRRSDHSERNYLNSLTSAFNRLSSKAKPWPQYVPRIHVDAANGVGAVKLKIFRQPIGQNLDLTICNDGSGILNHMCGADYVKVNQKPSQGMKLQPNERYASFDGDADRLMYFFVDDDEKFQLLDGDRLASLFAAFIQELLKTAGLEKLRLGIVQTAYANGNSTNYMKETLGVTVECAPTGVKYLHHKAMQFDIGIYFEANGHGTVLFSKNTIECFKKTATNTSLSEEERDAADSLLLLSQLINQTVGDAIADMLAVEAILRLKHWTLSDWLATYQDLPNKLIAVKGINRSILKMTEDGTKFIVPKGLQELIDKICDRFPSGRSFGRPSGTEDVVRVYAEAQTAEMAQELADLVAEVIFKAVNS